MTATVSDPPPDPPPIDPAPVAEPAVGPDEASTGRPLGIVILSVLVLALGVQSLLVAFGVAEARYGSLGAWLTDPTQAKAAGIAVGAVAIYGAVAMWLYWRSGWFVTILLAGMGLVLQIVQYIWASPNYLSLTLWVVTAFYLNQREVKARFLRPPTQATTVTLTTAPDDAA